MGSLGECQLYRERQVLGQKWTLLPLGTAAWTPRTGRLVAVALCPWGEQALAAQPQLGTTCCELRLQVSSWAGLLCCLEPSTKYSQAHLLESCKGELRY